MRSVARFLGHFEWQHSVEKMTSNHWKPETFCCQYCTRWWHSAVSCRDICRCSNGKVRLNEHTGSVPSHYLNQWWLIINWTLRNKLQRNFDQNATIFIQENPFENIICKMSVILYRPQGICLASGDNSCLYQYQESWYIFQLKINWHPLQKAVTLFQQYSGPTRKHTWLRGQVVFAKKTG